MIQLSPDSQVDTFRVILEMETRGQQIDDILARLKHVFLQDAGSISIPTAVGTLDELRWHITQITDQLNAVEQSIGIQRRPVQRERKPTQPSSPGQFRGSTDTIPATDLMGLLAAQKKTGTLRIKAESGARFVLELLEGQVVHAATDSPVQSQLLGNILVAHGKITEEQLQEFLANFPRGNKRVGAALMASGLVDQDDLLGALEDQVRQLVQRIVGIESALFCFSEGPVSNIELRVRMNTTHLLLDAARASDEEAAAAHGIPDEAIAEAVEEAVEAVRTVAAAVTNGAKVTDESAAVENDDEPEACAEADSEVASDVEEQAEVEVTDEETAEPGADEPPADVADEARDEVEDRGEDDAPQATVEEPTVEEAAIEEPADEQPPAVERFDVPKLVVMLGIRPITAEEFVRQGLTTAEALRNMSDEDLLSISGIGQKVLDRIRKL